MVKKNYDDMLSRFHLIPERYGRTDRQTDRFAISISRVSILRILTRDKNCAVGRPMLKLTTDKHEASRGLSATAELLVFTEIFIVTFINDCAVTTIFTISLLRLRSVDLFL